MSAAAFGAGRTYETALRDGFVLAAVDGKLTGADSNGGWFFEFDSDINDDKGRILAGASLELLPSAALEKMTADAKMRSKAGYRLWGKVTKYENTNFIFPFYSLPVSKIEQPQQSSPQKPQPKKRRVTINEPNDTLAIPRDIVAKLRKRKIIRTEQLEKGLELKTDSILADRTAFLVEQPDGQLVFVLDALGRNVGQISFRLLPCETLQQTRQEQSAELEPLRFKVAGIVTRYKGDYYLLLQRATPVYSYGNFGR